MPLRFHANLGYFVDNFSGDVLGLKAIAMSLIFVLVYLLARQLWMDNVVTNVAVVFGASLLKAVSVAVLLALYVSGDYPWRHLFSTIWIEARSIWEYDFTTPTRSEMQRVDSLTSASRVSMVSEFATHSSPTATDCLPSRASTCSHQPVSSPADASGGPITQSRSMSRSTNQSEMSSSRRATASGVIAAG